MALSEWIGWTATAVFAASYLARDPRQLRLVQAAAAVLWIGYGVLKGAAPVIGANAAVTAIALISFWRSRAPRPQSK
ncbi:MAG: hypothetical protein N2036_12990 [Bryobacteraceae bacterium]|nr:hypothetical protein [Bryobacteraceae bacterium]